MFRAAFGDDKDRVVRRSSEVSTPISPPTSATTATSCGVTSIRAIDVLGADHHGYVGRLRAAWEALGGDPDRLEIQIMQLVNLFEGGEQAQMSKQRASSSRSTT